MMQIIPHLHSGEWDFRTVSSLLEIHEIDHLLAEQQYQLETLIDKTFQLGYTHVVEHVIKINFASIKQKQYPLRLAF